MEAVFKYMFIYLRMTEAHCIERTIVVDDLKACTLLKEGDMIVQSRCAREQGNATNELWHRKNIHSISVRLASNWCIRHEF